MSISAIVPSFPQYRGNVHYQGRTPFRIPTHTQLGYKKPERRLTSIPRCQAEALYQGRVVR